MRAVNEYLQFDVGPPTRITGVVTKGRGDARKPQWVTNFLLKYSNDSVNWKAYKDLPSLPEKVHIFVAQSLEL